MSIQDESFPNDEFFDELNFSIHATPAKRFQFPNHRHCRLQQQQQQQQQQQHEHIKYEKQYTNHREHHKEEEEEEEEEELKQVGVEEEEEYRKLHYNMNNDDRHDNDDREVKEEEDYEHCATNRNTNSHTHNDLSSSSSIDQNLSRESINERSPSCMSSKTTASDPTGLADNDNKKSTNFSDKQRQHNKSISYQDIHSEYTKRRYKHVESKVGQYIANMKAEDQKRRNMAKFQRHRSMPESFCRNAMAAIAAEAAAATSAHRDGRHYSANELHALNESTSDDDDDDNDDNDGDNDGDANVDVDGNIDVDSSENMTATTSSSSRVGVSGSSCGDGTSSCDTNFIDKQTYARLIDEKERLQSYSDYLQTKLDEKIGENLRLQRNVDYMRIELTNCKDKLKRQQTSNNSSYNFGSNIGSNMNLNSYMMSGVNANRQSLQSLLYCATKAAKSTQTDVLNTTATTPTPMENAAKPLLPSSVGKLYETPDTPDDNNNNMYENSSDAGHMGNGSSAGTNTGIIAPSDKIVNVGIGHSFGNVPATSNNNNAGSLSKTGKNVATIQPLSLNFNNFAEQDNTSNVQNNNNRGCGNTPNILRQRTNSNSSTRMQQTEFNTKSTSSPKPQQQQHQHQPQQQRQYQQHQNNRHNQHHNTRQSNPSSSGDSAIDIETIEMSSPKYINVRCNKNPRPSSSSSPSASRDRSNILHCDDEFIFYNKNTGRYSTLMDTTINNNNSSHIIFNENDGMMANYSGVANGNGNDIDLNIDTGDDSRDLSTILLMKNNRKYAKSTETAAATATATAAATAAKQSKAKHCNSLKRRWLRLFAPCTRCNEHNRTLDDGSALQQTYTQIPLLEKSFVNHCRTLQ